MRSRQTPKNRGHSLELRRRAARRLSSRDVGLLACSALAGLGSWFMYVAIQPRDYTRSSGWPDRMSTLFGWPAPFIDPEDFKERDRVFVAIAGWLVIGLIAGKLRPKLWPFIGPAVVLPTLLVYFATVSHDAEGWWRYNVVYFPFTAAFVSIAALVAPLLDWLFRRKAPFGCVIVVLFGVALLTGGDPAEVVVPVVIAPAAVIAAFLLARDVLAARS